MLGSELIDALAGRDDVGAFDLLSDGVSMFPLIRPGSTLRVAKVNASDLRAGDIVVFKRANRLIGHRVIRSGKASPAPLTRGDALIRNDEPITPDQIVGKVVSVTRPSGKRIRQEDILWIFAAKVMTHFCPFPQYLCRALAKVSLKLKLA